MFSPAMLFTINILYFDVLDGEFSIMVVRPAWEWAVA
jgi:hypothetical protein